MTATENLADWRGTPIEVGSRVMWSAARPGAGPPRVGCVTKLGTGRGGTGVSCRREGGWAVAVVPADRVTVIGTLPGEPHRATGRTVELVFKTEADAESFTADVLSWAAPFGIGKPHVLSYNHLADADRLDADFVPVETVTIR